MSNFMYPRFKNLFTTLFPRWLDNNYSIFFFSFNPAIDLINHFFIFFVEILFPSFAMCNVEACVHAPDGTAEVTDEASSVRREFIMR